MPSKIYSFYLPTELVEEIDRKAALAGLSRSAYIARELAPSALRWSVERGEPAGDR